MFAYRYSLLAIRFLYCDERSDEATPLLASSLLHF